MTLKTYQFTLCGFDGSTSDTDHLIKWIGAETQAAAEAYARGVGWDFESVEEIHEGNPVTFEDGCDVILPINGPPMLAEEKTG